MLNQTLEPDLVQSMMYDTAFKPGAWLAKIDFINHLVLFNNVLMVVLAEQGGGKTTFVKLLQSNLDTTIKSLVVNATTPFHKGQILSQIAQTFHLRTDESAGISNLIDQINERKAHVLIIIDDAHHIPDLFLHEVLSEIKKQGNSGFFHLCLVSDYSLASSLNRLDAESFKNLIHTIEPGSLSENETKTYLLGQMTSLNRTEKAMTAKRLKQFYELTGGDIARINQEMMDFFNKDSVTTNKKANSISKRMSVAISFVVVGLASAYMWQNQALFSPSLVSQTDKKPALREITAMSKVAPVEPPLVSEIPAFYLASIRQPVQPSPLKKAFDLDYDEDERTDNMVVMDKVLVIPKSIQKRTTVPADVLPSKLVAIQSVVKIEKQQPQHQGHKIVATGKKVTIQLLASRNRSDIQRFMASQKIEQPVQIRSVKRDGQVWYVLTMGEYVQLDEAKIVMNQLPTPLRQFKPWIRPVSGLIALG